MSNSSHLVKVGRLLGRFLVGQGVGIGADGCEDVPAVGIVVVFRGDMFGLGDEFDIGPIDGWELNASVGFTSSTSDVKTLGLKVRYSIGACDGFEMFSDVVE